jgi:O-antigen/teichoic acid export membrane protein
MSGVLRDQGGNILVNLFSGPAVNAARGLAVQLNGAIQSFVTNFMTAVNPQITKSYASGDHQYMFSLMRKSSRMSFYLLFILALPVLFNTEYVMSLWLKDVPDHAVLFVQLFLVFTLSESISLPLITAMFATGKVRDYQIVVGGLQLLNLPLSYLFLKAGAIPEVTVIVAIALSHICLFARLHMLKRSIGISPVEFIRRVYLNVLGVASVAIVLPLVFLQFNLTGAYGFLIQAGVAVVSAVLSVAFVGCTGSERQEAYGFIMNRLFRKR